MVMKVGQKFSLRDKINRDQQKQAWIEHEDMRRRKYLEFQQKKKGGNDSNRYNEALSAKTRLNREHEANAGKMAPTSDKQKGTGAKVGKSVFRKNSSREDKTKTRKDVNTPAFTGDFVTLTKEQLKLLLDAAEGSKNTTQSANARDEHVAIKPSSNNPYDSAHNSGKKSIAPVGEPKVVVIDQDQIRGLPSQSTKAHETPTENLTKPPILSLAEKKRQQWAIEKEELGEYMKEAANPVLQKIEINPDSMSPRNDLETAIVSDILSESLRKKKFRQWELENKFVQEAKGSLAEIGMHDNEKVRIKPDIVLAAPAPSLSEQKKVSLVEKKKRQWAIENGFSREGAAIGEWFGKPGAGAPIRTEEGDVLTQYGARANETKSLQENLAKNHGLIITSRNQNSSVVPIVAPDFSSLTAQSNAPNNSSRAAGQSSSDLKVPPAAMRSAFAAGGAAPDDRRFKDVKERERQLWLEDLKRQSEEKQAQKAKEKQQLEAYYREEDVQHSSNRIGDSDIVRIDYDSKKLPDSDRLGFPSRFRGYETELARIERHQREAGDKSNQLRQNLVEAEMEAQRNRLLKRIEKLRAGGHDTRGLERTYRDLLTPRSQANVPSIALENMSERHRDEPLPVQYQATRILTPTDRKSHRLHFEEPYFQNEVGHEESTGLGHESCAVQTEDFVFASGKRLQDILREQSKVDIEFREGEHTQVKADKGKETKKQNFQQQKMLTSKPPINTQSKKSVEARKPPVSKPQRGEKKPWQYQNTKGRQAVKASDRDIAVGSAERREKEQRRKERAANMLAMAETTMARSRLVAQEHGRTVLVEELPHHRSRSHQRTGGPQMDGRPARHVSPPPDLPSARYQQYEQPSGRDMPPPPQRQPAAAEYLPYRRSSAKLVQGEIPANYEIMIDEANQAGAGKGELMRQHLQVLRQGLMQRQQELERSMSPNTLSEVRASHQYRQV